ncbi:MAG: HU family DNA-binding protein [Myxococcales bacterium]|nr:HU family DNA-binding protein [Myxococcales bacterium]
MAKAKAAPAKKPAKASVKKLTKAGLITAIHEALGDDGPSKTQIKGVLEKLVEVGQSELKKTKVFVLPGFAKFVVATRRAVKGGEYVNPFTKQKAVRKDKPAGSTVRARPIKALKDSVN